MESFTQSSSKKDVEHYREDQFSVHPYVSKGILTFGIPIPVSCMGLNPDFLFISNLERK